MPAGDRRRRRRRKIVGAAGAAVMLATAVLTTTVNYWPGAQSSLSGAAKFVRLWLDADRDIGALPARDSWCAGADHCWIMQQSSGDATDYGDAVSKWHLTPSGSPRAGVLTSLPQRDATGWVDYTSELATWGAGTGTSALSKAGVTGGATNVLTVTMIVRPNPQQALASYVSHRDGSSPNVGWYIYSPDSVGNIRAAIDYGAGASSLYGSTDLRGAWHCVSVVLDARTAGAGRVYVDGTDDTSTTKDLSAGSGGFVTSAPFRVHGSLNAAGYASDHGIARVAVHEGRALTLAEHTALCGDLWQAPTGGPADDKPSAADSSWWAAGDVVGCHPTSGTTAVCAPVGAAPYYVASGVLYWASESPQQSRLTNSANVSCSTWTCRGTGTATPGAVAPDGSATASAMSLGGVSVNDVYLYVSGFNNSVTLYPRLWVKCSSGTLQIVNAASGSLGNWRVDCSAVGGVWTLINSSSHAAVTEIAPWASSAGGAGGMNLSALTGSVAADVWAPTLAAEAGSGLMVIQTASAAATASYPGPWRIDNAARNYYRAGDTVTASVVEHDGSCLAYVGTDLVMSGSAPASCGWHSLQITRGGTAAPNTTTAIVDATGVRVKGAALEYDIRRTTTPAIRLDMWAIYALYQLDGAGARIYGDATPITAPTSVWELTAYDATDFVGGGHGWESYTAATLYVDGSARAMDATATHSGRDVRLRVVSELSRHDDTKIADVVTDHVWRGDNYSQSATVTWAINHTTSAVYSGQFPIRRTIDASQITSAADYSPLGPTALDVSTTGHGATQYAGRHYVRIYDPGAGIDFGIRHWANGTTIEHMQISNAAAYNKVYADVQPGSSVAAGAVWHLVTDYRWLGGTP